MTEKKAGCPCPHTSCARHGDCTACRAHHLAAKRPVYCQRREKGKKIRAPKRA